jgi:hypothetical protein
MVLNKKFIIGLGVGMVISALLIMAVPPAGYSKGDVEKAARDMGMIYPDDVKAMFQTGK